MKVKQPPRKRIKVSQAAKMIGCCSNSIIQNGLGGFQLTRMNPGSKTSAWMVYEAEVKAFLERVVV